MRTGPVDSRKVHRSGGIRYDHAWSYYPAQQIGPTQFIPQALVFPESKGVIGYHDINPRFGLAYDVFGNGKTALKFNTGRVPGSRGQRQRKLLGVAAEQPGSDERDAVVDRRQRNFADCDLLNGEAQDLRSSGGDSCGRWSNLNFGKNVHNLSYDEAILKGCRYRPSPTGRSA